MHILRFSLLITVILTLGACAILGDFASNDPGLVEKPGRFEGRFAALSDADMAGTAYADGDLELFEGATDTLTLFDNGASVATAAQTSNSVISWPQVVDANNKGDRIYVAETRGPPPAGAQKMGDVYTEFPEGGRMTVLAAYENDLEIIQTTQPLGVNLQSVEISENSAFAIIASEKDNEELIVMTLNEDGALEKRYAFDLDPPYANDDKERHIRTIHISPDNKTLAANVGNRRIQFYSLEFNGDAGAPSISKLGVPTQNLGRRLATGKWTPDGRYFLISDTNWSDSTLRMLTQGPGALTALAPPDNKDAAPRIVSHAKVGRSPEGFAISADGALVASINMERTYLPELPFLSFWQGRRRYSVSLLTLSKDGILEEVSRVYQAGILPEDVIFDDAGANLAVAVFHRRKGADRQRGFIDFFAIEKNALKSQGVTQPVMRGPHDLVPLR